LEGRLEAGTAGRTHPTNATINLYPEQNNTPADMNNTLTHELLHAMRVNQGQTHYGKGVEEAFARYGTGYPRDTWLSEMTPAQRTNLTPDQHQAGMGMFMKDLMGNAPVTQPSRGLPALPEPAASPPAASTSMLHNLLTKFYGVGK
jgi:hypothetical protein